MTTTSADDGPDEPGWDPANRVPETPFIGGDHNSPPESHPADGEGVTVDHERKREPGRTEWKIKAFNRFIDETLASLPSTAAVLWLTLFRFERQGVARASLNTLAKRMGVDRKTVDRNMRLLQKHELIKKERQGGIGKGSNEYRLGLLPLEPRAKPQRRSKALKYFRQSKPK